MSHKLDQVIVREQTTSDKHRCYRLALLLWDCDFHIAGMSMEMVSSYCHLGHVVTSNLDDSPDYKLFICVAHIAHVCRPAVVNCGTVSYVMSSWPISVRNDGSASEEC